MLKKLHYWFSKASLSWQSKSTMSTDKYKRHTGQSTYQQCQTSDKANRASCHLIQLGRDARGGGVGVPEPESSMSDSSLTMTMMHHHRHKYIRLQLSVLRTGKMWHLHGFPWCIAKHISLGQSHSVLALHWTVCNTLQYIPWNILAWGPDTVLVLVSSD